MGVPEDALSPGEQRARAPRPLLALLDAGKLAPHVDRSFPFSEARDAFAYLEQGKSVGKVVLIPD